MIIILAACFVAVAALAAFVLVQIKDQTYFHSPPTHLCRIKIRQHWLCTIPVQGTRRQWHGKLRGSSMPTS